MGIRIGELFGLELIKVFCISGDLNIYGRTIKVLSGYPGDLNENVRVKAKVDDYYCDYYGCLCIDVISSESRD